MSVNNIAVLPIRSGSKRIANKNFLTFCGIPLYVSVLAELVNSNRFDKVILAVDDPDQIHSSIRNDARVNVYKRLSENSKDESPSESVLLEIAEVFSIARDDFLFLFQATNPFLRRKYVEQAVNVASESACDSIISAVESLRFPISEVVGCNFHRDRTQQRKSQNLETGLLWGVKCENLLSRKSRIGVSPAIIKIDENDDFDIDTYSDLQFIYSYLENYLTENLHIRDTLLSWFPLETNLLIRQNDTKSAMTKTFSTDTIETIRRITNRVKDSITKGGKILIFGNGGSAADSQHIAAEFVSRLKVDRIALPAIALTTDTSALTAISNDYGFEYVFERQVKAIVQPNDIVIGITTSGNSLNVTNALVAAKDEGAFTVMLTGKNPRKQTHVDETIFVASSNTATIQEIHIQLGHMLCAVSEEPFV